MIELIISHNYIYIYNWLTLSAYETCALPNCWMLPSSYCVYFQYLLGCTKIIFSCHISGLTVVYGRYNELVHGVKLHRPT